MFPVIKILALLSALSISAGDIETRVEPFFIGATFSVTISL